MSDEREQTKPGEPDFQLHQLKHETVEPVSDTEIEDTDGSDDFEAHQLKPGGVADQLKNQLKN